MNATVSVIIPMYNVGAYLGECLDSVFAGTYQDFHIFLCDDGSSDDTLGVARRYQEQHGKITVVTNERNRGASYTRNRLLDMADGKYIAFHDGDDLMTPGRLQEQVEFLDAHADIDAVGGQLCRLTDDPGDRTIYAFRPLVDADIKIYMGLGLSICICTTTIRRERLRASAVRFDENYQIAVDYDFFSRLVPHMRFANVATPQVIYRVHTVSLTQRLPELQAANHIKVAKRHLRTSFNIDAQDDVINISSWPQNHPPRGVSAEQSELLQRLVSDLLNTDLVQNGGVTDETKWFISYRLLTYLTRIPLSGRRRRASGIDLRPSAVVNKTPMDIIKRRIKWYVLCALEITRLWRLRSVRQLIWKHQYSQKDR